MALIFFEEAGYGLELVTPYLLAWPDPWLGGLCTVLGGWSGLTQPHPRRSSCQLANLLAGFAGWFSMVVGEALISHGTFPVIVETARRTFAPLP